LNRQSVTYPRSSQLLLKAPFPLANAGFSFCVVAAIGAIRCEAR
jgi:hypothetical protein